MDRSFEDALVAVQPVPVQVTTIRCVSHENVSISHVVSWIRRLDHFTGIFMLVEIHLLRSLPRPLAPRNARGWYIYSVIFPVHTRHHSIRD